MYIDEIPEPIQFLLLLAGFFAVVLGVVVSGIALSAWEPGHCTARLLKPGSDVAAKLACTHSKHRIQLASDGQYICACVR